MVQSMTGYGAGSVASENYKVTVELKSLNSKYIEINMKLPRTYMQEEMGIRNLITKTLGRGKINAVLNVDVLNPEKHRLQINRPLVEAYAATLEALRTDLGLNDQTSLEYLLSLPDALSGEADKADTEEWQLIEQAFREAVKKLKISRSKEGAALEKDMRSHNANIRTQLEIVRELQPRRMDNIRNKINNSLQEVRDRAQLDGNRYEQELIYYIEKFDINEEMVRLNKHLEYFDQTLNDAHGNGKKLGFISQEMGREINTIGSKANDAEIQKSVVTMKEELEKIKEQVLNVV